jgi:flagellar L-ring protein precursor FlgH
MKRNRLYIISLVLLGTGCGPQQPGFGLHHPAEEFSRAVESGEMTSYSFRKSAKRAQLADKTKQAEPTINDFASPPAYQGNPRMLEQGLTLKRSFSAPTTIPTEPTEPSPITMGGGAMSARGQLAEPGSSPSPSYQEAAYSPNPPGASRSPYLQGPMTANPSLWMDSSQNVFLYNDHRAFSPMDIVTIEINDKTLGRKRANTQTRSEFDLLAGISNFFGFETRVWEANNEGLSADALIQANTQKEFRGEGDMQRQAQLQAQISGVVLEVLPNGVLRIEGSKIVAINAEEEIMVISGLIRQRDINAENKVDSNRVANMRIDFYGHGTLSDAQGPGWGASLFNKIWPF